MKPRRVVFRVEVRISDRWMVIEGATALAQPVAHVLCARESARVGSHRVRMIPVPLAPKGQQPA